MKPQKRSASPLFQRVPAISATPRSLLAAILSFTCILPLTVDPEGVTVDEIIRRRPKLIYSTPSHQFPTGVIMTPTRRQALLAAADATGAYVIEDDYDGEIIYDRPPVAALASGLPSCQVSLIFVSRSALAFTRHGNMNRSQGCGYQRQL